MSVLTQVLNDLAARGAPPLPPLAPRLAVASASPAPPALPRRQWRRRAIGLVALMLVAGTAGTLTFMDDKAAHEAVRIKPLGLAEYANALPAEVLPSAPAAGATVALPASAPGATAAGKLMPVASTASSASAPTPAPAGAAAAISAPDRPAATPPLRVATTSAPTSAAAPADAVTPAVAQGRGTPPLRLTAARPSMGTASEPLPSTTTPPAAAPAPTAAVAAATAPGRAAPAASADGAAVVRRSSASLNDPQGELARAADLIARGRTTEARLVLASALERDPRQGTARAALASLLAEAGERHQALATLLDGAALEPARFALPAAQLQNELGDAQGALATLARMPIERRDGAYFAIKGGIALVANQAPLAVESYQRALRSPNAQPVWLVGLGLALEAAGLRQEAHAAFARLEQLPNLSTDLHGFARQKKAATQ